MIAGQYPVRSDIDLGEIARRSVLAAAAVTTGRLGVASPDDVYALLRAGDPKAIVQFRHDLAFEISSTILWMDPLVKAVYADPIVQRASLSAPVRLIVHARHESAALRSVVDAIQEEFPDIEVDGFYPLRNARVEVIVIDDDRLNMADRGYLAPNENAIALVKRPFGANRMGGPDS